MHIGNVYNRGLETYKALRGNSLISEQKRTTSTLLRSGDQMRHYALTDETKSCYEQLLKDRRPECDTYSSWAPTPTIEMTLT